MDKLVESGDWELLKDYSKRNYENYKELDTKLNFAVYFNIAQAYQGRLVDDLFESPKLSLDGFMLTEGAVYSVCSEYGPTFAHALFAMGDMAAAQRKGVNFLYTSNGGIEYSMLKLLAMVELMRGQDKVADKYLKILSKKKDYREWAKNARLDPDIERGRKNIAYHFNSEAFIEGLLDILASDPSDSLTMQYCLSYLLLSKVPKRTYWFIDEYYGCPSLKKLPVPAQEALVYYAGYMKEEIENFSAEDWCLSHGVSEETFRRFELFTAAVNHNDKWALMNYKNSFWHYVTFTEL